MREIVCKGCGRTFTHIKREGERGRYPVKCSDCRPSNKPTPVRDYKKGSKDGPDANIKQRTFNKKSKRDHQEFQFTDDWAAAGIDKIPAGRKIAILGDLQDGKNDQIQLLYRLGKIESNNQILSFCDDEIVPGKNIGGLAKNKKNMKLYEGSTCIFGNMVDYIPLINDTCDAADYDACSALMPTSRATREVRTLLGKLTVKVFQVNILVDGWGTNGYRTVYDDLTVFYTMPAFEDWEMVCEPREYLSIADDGSGQKWTYRTYTFVRK